ncbi:hypothetical protein [Flavobacterium sp. CSZ]|uniref:hypothetical protein n=1 Tax=Flavobacterium sp. CSZ TaxID=2783791 RepID=UPI00188A50BC|nr:hypothetical protein [Flavobacterium sp. CSZ]MBF4485721.1 hypothetical protein [Flavobacterium sp. CSZ]
MYYCAFLYKSKKIAEEIVEFLSKYYSNQYASLVTGSHAEGKKTLITKKKIFHTTCHAVLNIMERREIYFKGFLVIFKSLLKNSKYTKQTYGKSTVFQWLVLCLSGDEEVEPQSGVLVSRLWHKIFTISFRKTVLAFWGKKDIPSLF